MRRIRRTFFGSLVLIGLLLFGRDLPNAGRKMGRVVAQLKRSFQDFKEQIDQITAELDAWNV